MASDLFTMALIIGSISCTHAVNRQVGSGSNSHDLFGEDMIIWSISYSVAGENEARGVEMS